MQKYIYLECAEHATCIFSFLKIFYGRFWVPATSLMEECENSPNANSNSNYHTATSTHQMMFIYLSGGHNIAVAVAVAVPL